MHAHVDEYSAAVGAEGGFWRRAVPLKVRHRIDLTKLAARDSLAQTHERRHKTSPETDLERQAGGVDQRRRLPSFGGCHPDGLLAQRGHVSVDEALDRPQVEAARPA